MKGVSERDKEDKMIRAEVGGKEEILMTGEGKER